MIVGRTSFASVIERLKTKEQLSLDTETTGVRPYHGDRLFSLIIGYEENGKIDAYYFNFWPSYEGVPAEQVLSGEHLKQLDAALFSDPNKRWYVHKFNFDWHVLKAAGYDIKGSIFCTMTQGRVEYNEHFSYDLADSLSRIGLKKDDKVEAWIEEHKAYEQVPIPGKKQRDKRKHFEKVPYDIIVPYGLDDGRGGYALGKHLQNSIAEQAKEYPENAPFNIIHASRIEERLSKTVLRMENVGVKIDKEYCQKALAYESDQEEKARKAFERETHAEFKDHWQTLKKVFLSDQERWEYTEKGNPSFNSDVLKTFKHPAARHLIQRRAAKSKLDFYHGFLYHADRDGIVHAQFKPGGTRTFRFSSSEPNLQNLTSEEATYCNDCKEWFEQYTLTCPDCAGTNLRHPEYMVRKAIIPRPGFVFIMPDLDQAEYKHMLEYGKMMMIRHLRSLGRTWDEGYFDIANRVAQGYDVHQATAEMMGVTRKYAKTLNFMLLYGGGPAKLAAALGIPLDQAIALRSKYFKALPYVQFMIGEIMDAVRKRGWLRNWAGYKFNFPNREFAYTGPNTIIQSGVAVAVKIMMNRIDEYLLTKKSRLVLSVHDELPCEVAEDEIEEVPRVVKEIMETTYPAKYVPFTAGMEWSPVSLADKMKGFPHGDV